MTRPKRIAGTVAHRGAILLYIAFALFPLYWLLKVSVTPNDLLYSEGVLLWPSRASFEHYLFVLEHSDFPRFIRNSVIVSGATAFIVTILASCAGYATTRGDLRGSNSAGSRARESTPHTPSSRQPTRCSPCWMAGRRFSMFPESAPPNQRDAP